MTGGGINDGLPPSLAALPPDFLFGTATAAYQIEGAVAEGGRGVSIWDTFAHTPGATRDGDTGDGACDHYHRWESDLDLMVELGLPAYRLSLSWARLQPTGTGELNAEGVAFYRDLLAGCHQRGITPLVTLYHWDLPQVLQDAGGWPSRTIVERFADYAGRCIDAFVDLADRWITINEPICVALLGHALGVQAPGIRDPGLAIRAAHHTLLAHGRALQLFRERAAWARVGITNLIANVNPGSDDPADVAAAAVADIRMNRLFIDPCYRGEYPADVVAAFAAAGLNTGESVDGIVQPGDMALISAPTDFVGVNHYTNLLVYADPDAPTGSRFEHVGETPSTFGWSVTPDALHAVLTRIGREYSSLPIIVTENGISLDDTVEAAGAVDDTDRIDYLRGYIDAVGRAVADGIDVRGYFAWSFLDNFEWAEGYSKRFGIVHVDYATQQRTPKASAYWYRDMIATFAGLPCPAT